MERYMRFIIRRRAAVICCIAVITALLGYQCKNLRLAINLKEQLPQNHPYVQIQNRVEELFGGDSQEVIGVFANQGTIYAPHILKKILRLTDGALNTPGIVQSSVVSIASPNVKTIEDKHGQLFIEPLLQEPITEESISAMRQYIDADPLLSENLINENATAAVIAMDIESVSDAKLQKALEALVAAEQDDSVTIALAGGPTLRAEIARYTALIFPLLLLAVIVIGIIHFEAFRTVQAVCLPIVTAILCMVWSMGILGLTGQTMDTWSSVTPIAILAIAAGHAVQILKRYYEELRRAQNHNRALIKALSEVGPVMMRVCCIAAFGFGSLVFVGIKSVRVFGILLATGIVSAMIIEMTLIPAIRSIMTPSARERERESSQGWLEYALVFLAQWVVKNPKQCLIASAVSVISSGIGMRWIEVNNNVYHWLPQSSLVLQDYQLLNTRLRGSTSLKLLVEGAPQAIERPDVLRALNDLEEFMRRQEGIVAVSGLADIVRRMHKAMTGNDTIPESQNLVAQYLLLYGLSGPDVLTNTVDTHYANTVIRAFSKDSGTGFAEHVFAAIRAYADNRFVGLPVEVKVAGGALGVNAAMDQVVTEEKEINIAQVGCVIFIFASLFLASLLGGVFVTIPMILAIIINAGLMGWLGIWFNMSSAAISAMGVSIGADFAVYLIFRIREEAERENNFTVAVQNALLTSGKAIFFVSSAMIGGFMILFLSPFVIWRHLGMLTSLIIAVHALSAVTVLPALIVLFRPRFAHGHKICSAPSSAPH